MNYEGAYFAEGFPQNFCPCLDIALGKLRVIEWKRNKFAEIVAVADCFLITNRVKNKELKKQLIRICLRVKLPNGRMSMKKEKNSS